MHDLRIENSILINDIPLLDAGGLEDEILR